MGLFFLFILLAHVHLHLSLPMPMEVAAPMTDLSGLDIPAPRGPQVQSPLPRVEVSAPQLDSNIEDAIRPTDILESANRPAERDPPEPVTVVNSIRNWTATKIQLIRDVGGPFMDEIFQPIKTAVNNLTEYICPPVISVTCGAFAQLVKCMAHKKDAIAKWSSLPFDVMKNKLGYIDESSIRRFREQAKTAHNLITHSPIIVKRCDGTQKVKYLAHTYRTILEWRSLAIHWIKTQLPSAQNIGKSAIRQISRGTKKVITQGREWAHPISVKGDDAAYIANYMADHQAKIDNRLINQLHDSLSAENVEPAKVKYSIEVIEFIRAPAKGWDRSYLFEYFQRKLGLSEFVRRKNVLLLQAEERALQEAWPNQAIEISRMTGYDAETINKYAKVLGMGEYFPAFKNQPGMEKNIRRLAFLQQTLPQLHDAFKDALGDIAYHSRMCIMSVMDNLISPDIPEFLITEWQEQGFSVSRIVQIIDYTRYDTVDASIPWRGNPPEYNKISKMIHSLNSNILEEKEIYHFLNHKERVKFEELKNEIHVTAVQSPHGLEGSITHTHLNNKKKSWWTKLLDFLKKFIPQRFQASPRKSMA
ncbi:hypothetical protein PCANC_18288 [Puccinia coronata f. sp. avenae]|uniref:Uncharacterized protein n=1 Tax=Puccinia coronata f. sp. avenae TaxID=200324 RepID=A0A2N5UFV6_9BASI|nr:hypothetical protein PCANC_18288 [Puccinia coronata f. sp. avenae]